MLQFPTNVYPQNTAIDISTDEVIRSFTFNGDRLTWVYSQIYDNETGEQKVYSYVPNDGDGKPFAYNGETVTVSSSAYQLLENGKDYAHRMVLCQNDENGNPIYDIYVGRGRVQGTEGNNYTASAFFIESSLQNIYEYSVSTFKGEDTEYIGWYEPLYYNDLLVAGLQIEINGKRYFVTHYHSYSESTNLGEINTDGTDEIEIGAEYKLYANYLVSPFYYFKCRTTPVVTVTAEGKDKGIECNATYSQAEQTTLKYYKFSLYEVDGETETLVNESEKIYSYRLNYTFPVDYAGKTYRVVCEACTQDNVVVNQELNVDFPVATEVYIDSITSLYFNSINNTVHISWNKNENYADCKTRIYREDISTGEIVFLMDTVKSYYDDYTVGNMNEYRYILVPYLNDVVGQNVISDNIEVKYVGWTITAITYNNSTFNNRLSYSVGDTWKIIGEIENVTVTQNTDKTLHVGSAKYPILSESETNYMSATLTALVGYMDCDKSEWVCDIDTVTAWRRFITQHCQFILRSQKGDVWAINITDNPSTEYDESTIDVITKFTFSWAEFEKIENITLR